LAAMLLHWTQKLDLRTNTNQQNNKVLNKLISFIMFGLLA